MHAGTRPGDVALDQIVFTPEDQEILEHSFPHATHPQLILYIRQRWLVKPQKHSQRNNSEALNDLSVVKPPGHSQASNDLSGTGISQYIDKLLQQRKNGFFVECGAYNGKDFSKTYFFETERNWTGLLIEPNPVDFQKLTFLKRNAFSINAAASPTGKTGKFYLSEDGVHSNLATFPSDILHRDPPPVTIVQAFTLLSMLLAANRTHIDYLALNVAGAELDILKTLPFHLVSVDVISVGYRRLLSHDIISPEDSRQQLQRVRAFFKEMPQYKELGLAPVADAYNVTLSEGFACDVIFGNTNVILS